MHVGVPLWEPAAVALQTTTDAATVRAWCEEAVAAEPVGNTTLGAVATFVRHDDSAPWAARDGADPCTLAARSQAHTPLTATAGWTDSQALADADLVPPMAALAGSPGLVAAVVAALDRPVTSTKAERLLRCDELVEPAAPGTARLAEAGDAGWLAEWFIAFTLEAFGRIPPGFDAGRVVQRGVVSSQCWIWTDGEPVSYAVSHPAQAGVSRIGPVYTPPRYRGRGYGAAATAAATRDILDRGDIACLFTDLANPTSNKIYGAIGYRAVLDRTLVRFD